MEMSGWPMNSYGYATFDMMLDEFASQIASSNLPIPSPTTTANTRASNLCDRAQKSRIMNPSMQATSCLDKRKVMGMSGGMIPGERFVGPESNLSTSHLYLTDNALPVDSGSNYPVDWCSISSPELPTCSSGITEQAYPFYLSSPLSNSYADELPVNFMQDSNSMPYSQTYSLDQNLMNGQGMYLQDTLCVEEEAFPYRHPEWDSMKMNDFDDLISTTQLVQESAPSYLACAPSQPNITMNYQTSPPEEIDGEELVGMGLYDSPESLASPISYPQSYNHSSCIMTPSRGKGLKLEETWNPPDESGKGVHEVTVSEEDKSRTLSCSSNL